MASHRERPPLLIEPRRSPRLLTWLVLTHLAALAAVLALPGWWRALALPVLGSLGYGLIVHWRRLAPWSIRWVLWQPDGRWRVAQSSGEEWEARLLPSTFVSLPLVVLNLKGQGWRRHSLPLFSDSLDPEQLRRLRQRLRIEGAGADTGNDAGNDPGSRFR